MDEYSRAGERAIRLHCELGRMAGDLLAQAYDLLDGDQPMLAPFCGVQVDQKQVTSEVCDETDNSSRVLCASEFSETSERHDHSVTASGAH